jgi:hypothetical protein
MDVPAPKRIVDLDRLQLFENFPGAEQRPGQPIPRSRLAFCVRDGYPRLTVWLNDPKIDRNDRQANVCSAPLDIITFNTFLELLKEVILSNTDIRYKIECFGSTWVDNKMTGEKKLVGELHFGKKDGVVWISVTGPNKPLVPFRLILSDWHSIYHGDGTEISKAEASAITAKSYLHYLQSIYEYLAVMQATGNAVRELRGAGDPGSEDLPPPIPGNVSNVSGSSGFDFDL